jgi:hypothetical protein
MRVHVYGVFLLSGEIEPVKPATCRAIQQRAARAVRARRSRAARIIVTLTETFGTDASIQTRCQVLAWSDGRGRVLVEEAGDTVEQAATRALRRLHRRPGRAAAPRRGCGAPFARSAAGSCEGVR